MSVPNQIPYIIYNANGLTTVFSFEFYIITASDIQVSINGVPVTSGFTVSGVGNVSGGDIIFVTPPANGAVVMLERVVPTYRLTDYQDNGDLLASTVNKDFDRLWMAIQRYSIHLGLALRRPLFGGPFDAEGYRISEMADPENPQDAANKNYVDNVSLVKVLRVPESYIPVLPPAEQRANKLLACNNVGDPIFVPPATGSASEVMIELAGKDGYSYIGELQSVSEFFGLVKQDGARVKLRAWHDGWAATAEGKPVGGGEFIYRTDVPKSSHNGGVFISDTVPWDGQQSSLAGYLAGDGETDPSGNGCWVRDYNESINLRWFGAHGDGVTDDTASISAWRDYVVSLPDKRKAYAPAGIYSYTSGPNWAVKGVHVFGDGKNNTVFKCTTAQRGFNIDASEYGIAVVYDVVLEDFCVEGHADCLHLIYVENVSHMTLRNINTREANSSSGAAFTGLFTVASVLENFTCSINEQSMTNKPYYGIVLGVSPSRNLRSTCNVITNPIIEGVVATGIRLISADFTTVIGGTSEANGLYGITTGNVCRCNTFKGMGFEANGTADILDAGVNTYVENCYTGTSIVFTATSRRPLVNGGLHERIEMQAGCSSAVIDGITINYFNTGSGGIVDNGTGTAFRNVFDYDLNAYIHPKKARSPITVSASPFTYTNSSGGFEYVLIVGGNVTQVLFKRDTDQSNTGVTSGLTLLAPGDQLVISYSTLPVVSRIPMGENFT